MPKIVKHRDDLVHWCPGCKHKHYIPMNKGIWKFNDNFDSPTLTPSVIHTKLKTGDRFPTDICHYFIRDGHIQFLNDCQHDLKGQTVELPEIEVVKETPGGITIKEVN